MAVIGRFNSLQVVKHTEFGLYLDGTQHGEILLPKRYVPKDQPSEVGDWLNVFIYLDSDDRLIATTQTPKVQVGGFASLKVVEINRIGLFLDWGLPKDLLLPHSEEKRPLQVGDYCVVYVYLDKRTNRITATARLDRQLDNLPPRYSVGQAVDLLVVERTEMGFKAIIEGKHWGLIHKNEAFKFLRSGMREQGYIKELRADGKIALSLQPVGAEAAVELSQQILARLLEAGGSLPLSDKSSPEDIHRLFGVSKGTFKKAIGGLYKKGLILIHPERIELPRCSRLSCCWRRKPVGTFRCSTASPAGFASSRLRNLPAFSWLSGISNHQTFLLLLKRASRVLPASSTDMPKAWLSCAMAAALSSFMEFPDGPRRPGWRTGSRIF